MKGVWVKSLCIYSDAGFCSYLAALMSVVVSNVKPLHTRVEQALRNAKTFNYVKYALRTRLPSHNVEISSTLIPIICSQRSPTPSRRKRRKPRSGGSSSFCPQVRRQILQVLHSNAILDLFHNLSYRIFAICAPFLFLCSLGVRKGQIIVIDSFTSCYN